MRLTSRYWAAISLAGVLTLTALLVDQPVLLVGGAGIGTWVLAQQYRFLRQTSETLAGLSVVQTSSRDRVVKGDPFTVTVAVSADHDVSLAVSVSCDPPVSVAGVDDTARSCRLETAERTATTTITGTASVAGQITFERPEVTVTDPFGFFELRTRLGESLSVQVAPRSPRELHIGAGGERLAVGYGEHDTAQLGTGLEPTEIREYSPGDNIRQIDWKATARLNYPHVRKFERKTQRRTALVVDHRAGMGFGPSGERMLDYAVDVALLFLTDARRNEDPVGLYAVGDEGTTAETGLSTGIDQYNRIRRCLEGLAPTRASGSDGPTFSTHQSRARQLAAQLSGATAFEEALRPYVSEREAYVRRTQDRPLFSAVRTHAAPLREATWTVLVTDDSDRAEIHDTVKLAQQYGSHVAVFLTPRVLFEEHGVDERDAAYRRYREFESFRQTLMELDGVTAFEVAPGNKLEAVLSVGPVASRGGGRDRAGAQSTGGGR